MKAKMDESIILEKLISFGLTRQEAMIYVCLFTNGELTGYEVAKQTGISRSNVYNGLSGLVDKGAAYRMDGAASKYVAVTVEEFCENKLRNMKSEKDYLMKNMPVAVVQSEGYITIEGAKNIRNKILSMLGKAKQRVYISAPQSFIGTIETELCEIIKREVKLVLITDKETNLKGMIQYLTDKKENQIRLIIDSLFVLTGDVIGTNADTCLYSGQTNFVNVFKEALSNEIELIKLTRGENEK